MNKIVKKPMRLLALDIDGTVVNSQHQVTEPVRRALIHAQSARDMRLVLASGRPTPALRHLVELLELKAYGGYLLPYNGGKAIDLSTGEVLYSKPLDEDLIPQLYHLIKAHGVSILTYTEEAILSEEEANEYAQREIDITGMPLCVLEDFLASLREPLPKCLAVGPTDRLVALEAAVKVQLGDRVDAFRSSDVFLELVPKGVNKGVALERLSECLGLTPRDLIAIGDNYNDVSMLRFAGTSIAMGNAPEDIQRMTTLVTRTNDEDGVAYALEHLIP